MQSSSGSWCDTERNPESHSPLRLPFPHFTDRYLWMEQIDRNNFRSCLCEGCKEGENPGEGSTPAAPALEVLLMNMRRQEPSKLSKLLKSVFLEGRKVLIAILLAICFTWHEPSSLEDRGVLWNLGSAWGCGGSRCWVRFGGDRCDAGQRRVILAFLCIRSCRGGCL